MSNWDDLLNRAGPASVSMADIKKSLPLPYVLETVGLLLVEGNGKLHALCPFHEDSDPSFDVYGENLERWGCFVCDAGGDVVDFLKRYKNLPDDSAAKAEAELHLATFATAEWDGPREGTIKKKFDLEYALDVIHRAELCQTGYLEHWLDERQDRTPGLRDVTAEWLTDTFRVGEEDGRIVVPYYNNEGVLVGYKHRTTDTPLISASGSSFKEVLYNGWNLSPISDRRPVLLCEGESDVWAAAWALGAKFDVVGLPTGAGAHPNQATLLAERDVYLAFDGDKAGRMGARRWHTALNTLAESVRVVPMPDGTDIASCSNIGALVRSGRRVPVRPQGFGVYQSHMAKVTGDAKAPNETPISNFGFVPMRELRGTDGAAYEGVLTPSGDNVVLSANDTTTKSRITQWAVKHGVAWYGSDRESSMFLAHLQAEAPFLAPGEMASVAGLHDGHFILPGHTVGPRDIQYVPPSATVHLEDRMTLAPDEDWRPEELGLLRSLHSNRVIDPILAWLAVAPLRSMFDRFPTLAVTGSSGSGKTTLLETVLDHFSGAVISTNLTSTTRHALFAFVGCTNGMPVWFDEYRPGARKDTMVSLEQVLRDAYTGQSSSKGGMTDNWAEVSSVHASAPLIVSGEDAFTETSHTERMVLVGLPSKGRNSDALGMLKALGRTGFSWAYLEWLITSFNEGELPQIVNYQAGPEDLPDRQRFNIGVLDLGWRILQQFMREAGGDLSAPDWGLITQEAEEAAASNPIRDALLWALDENDAFDCVVRDGDGIIWVRVENFVQYVNKRSDFVLPGGAHAVRRYLVDRYEAEMGRTRVFSGANKQKRALCLSLEED